MTKKEIVRFITQSLKDKDIRKKVPPIGMSVHIADDDGNKKTFTVRKDKTEVLYKIEDVDKIITEFLEAVASTLQKGEEVTIHGFGEFAPKVRAARSVKHPETGEDVEVAEHTCIKFTPGKRLKIAAKYFDWSNKHDSKVGD